MMINLPISAKVIRGGRVLRGQRMRMGGTVTPWPLRFALVVVSAKPCIEISLQFDLVLGDAELPRGTPGHQTDIGSLDDLAAIQFPVLIARSLVGCRDWRGAQWWRCPGGTEAGAAAGGASEVFSAHRAHAEGARRRGCRSWGRAATENENGIGRAALPVRQRHQALFSPCSTA